MRKRLIVLLIVIFPHLVKSNEIELLVVDQAGAPLPNAVVSLGLLETEASASEKSEAAIMDQVNVQFLPKVLTIFQGDKVAFPNSDNIRHHVYSFSKPKAFEIKLYSGTPSSPVMFNKPGIVVLGCNIHDQMIGYIYVGEKNSSRAEGLFITDEKGLVSVPELKVDKVKVWHERIANIAEPVLVKPVKLDGTQFKLEIAVKGQKQPEPKGFKPKFSKGQ